MEHSQMKGSGWSFLPENFRFSVWQYIIYLIWNLHLTDMIAIFNHAQNYTITTRAFVLLTTSIHIHEIIGICGAFAI